MKKIQNKRSIYIICILLAIIIGFIYIVLNKSNLNNKDNLDNTNNVKEKYEYLKLNDYLAFHNDPYDNYNIIYVEDGKIYGVIYNFPVYSERLRVNYLFMYDINNENYKEFHINEECNVMNFYVTDKYIYYVEIVYSETMKWELYISDLDWNNSTKIMEGNINSDLNGPKLFHNSKDNSLYLLAINNEEELEYLNLYKLEGENLFKQFTYSGNHTTKKGTFLQNMLYVGSVLDKLYFSLVYDYEKNVIYEYDFNTLKLKEIINKDISECYFSSYYFTSIGHYINGTKRDGNNDAYFYNPKTNKINNLGEKNLLYFGKKINDNNLLFHKDGNWFTFNVDTNIIEEYKLDDNYYIPNYHVLDNNRILVVNDHMNSYIINLEK